MKAVEAVNQSNYSYKFLSSYEKEWHKLLGKSYERMYRIKSAIMKLTDDDLNRTADIISEIPENKRSLAKIFKSALIRHPKLLFDVARAFTSI